MTEVLHPSGAPVPLSLPLGPLLPAHQMVESLQLLLQSTGVSVLDIYNEDGALELWGIAAADYTGRIRIQCQATVGLISGQYYYEFGVNESLVWSGQDSEANQLVRSKEVIN